MAPVVDNNQFELPTALETPSKKRKRNAESNPFLSFSDQTFSIPSSTPIHNKQIDGSAFENPSFRFGANGNSNGSNKENYNIFSDSCMEVKSIADLVAAENPFEVVRKPPSKKKRKLSEIEESCFVNPGLNLDAVDKPVVNPFEVVRQNDETSKQQNDSCFVNGALNIKGKDSGEALNPFEVSRPVGDKEEGAEGQKKDNAGCKGIENPALEIPTYALAVPFTPSINHRINFQELPADALTPCQMLAKNLVFTPEPNPESLITPKRTATVSNRKSLSVISEEALDIGEELDCYQLELENSINEAKALKQKSVRGSTGKRTKARRSLIDVKHISNLSMKLKQLEESEGEEEDSKPPKIEEEPQKEAPAPPTEQPASPPTPQPQITFTVTKEISVKEEIRINVSNPDVQFEEVDDFEVEEQDVDLFANPAPFQRAYRKKEDPNPEDNFKQPALPEATPSAKSHKVKDVIRRSFRKLIHPKQQQEQQVQVTDLDEKPKSEEASHHGFISSIRHSLRRKTHKAKESQPKREEHAAIEEPDEKELEMSVIVEAPRAVFRQPIADDYRTIAAGGVSIDKVSSTLRSSLRRSTKDMKRQMMKNVFKKADEEKE